MIIGDWSTRQSVIITKRIDKYLFWKINFKQNVKNENRIVLGENYSRQSALVTRKELKRSCFVKIFVYILYINENKKAY